MKKLQITALVILIFALSGCVQVEGPSGSVPTGNQIGDRSYLDDTEDNVNGEQIQIAGQREETHFLLPQETVEQHWEEIVKGELLLVPDCDEDQLKQDDQPCPLAEVPVVQEFSTQLPQGVEKELQYDQYPSAYDYILVMNGGVNIRRAPSLDSDVINQAQRYTKLNLLQEVKGQYLDRYQSDVWYRVYWQHGDEVKYGFIFGSLTEPRRFQFEKMIEEAERLRQEVKSQTTGYIANYKNRNGLPPLHEGKTVDPYGNFRSQSAAGYESLDPGSQFRYFPDGTLVSILGEDEGLYRVTTPGFPGEYWIDKKYISFRKSLEELTQVVVVDRKYQNQAAFEYNGDRWTVISYTFATTGVNDQYRFETPLGHFMAIETRDRFLYLHDITREIAGYAPYTIRFSGGGYIHGVPVDFQIVDGQRVDPGMKEYLHTIGSTPRSHKCVRNYTSHAKFLYEWIEIGNSAIIVIE